MQCHGALKRAAAETVFFLLWPRKGYTARAFDLVRLFVWKIRFFAPKFGSRVMCCLDFPFESMQAWVQKTRLHQEQYKNALVQRIP